RAYQPKPALLPEYGNMDTEKPESPLNLEVVIDSLTQQPVLRWECASDSVKAKNEVRFYAVYMFEDGDPVDVNNMDALVAFTPELEYTMPSVKDIYCRQIAVTAVDRMHNESKPVHILYDPEAE
ncbi:MAG: hypothetical protein II138_00750, partial [Paludibacteraceae bacterium]|nr:hypothetical protein [Paludibacteraceae bacterium]